MQVDYNVPAFAKVATKPEMGDIVNSVKIMCTHIYTPDPLFF